MTIALYAGSFDPITYGHLDIIKNSAEIFDRVIVAVAYNINKESFIPVKDRVEIIKKCVQNFPNVEVDSFEGLTVEYAKNHNASILIRGVRSSADYEYEAQLAQTNKLLNDKIKTILLFSKPEFSIISSSGVREIYKNGGDLTKFIPNPVLEYLKVN